MITLIYDAFQGTPHRDGEVITTVDTLAAQNTADTTQEIIITTATENLLNALRVAVRQEKIPLEQVRIVYRKPEDSSGPAADRIVKLYKSGGIAPWPNGFADITDRLLMELL